MRVVQHISCNDREAMNESNWGTNRGGVHLVMGTPLATPAAGKGFLRGAIRKIYSFGAADKTRTRGVRSTR